MFKVCWRQWLLWAWDQVLHDAACQELPWLPTALLLIPCLAPGSLPEGSAECYWAVMQWLPFCPAAADPPTELWLALLCMLKQMKILHPPPKALPDVFTNMMGHWDGAPARNLKDLFSFPSSALDFIFCPRQIASVL